MRTKTFAAFLILISATLAYGAQADTEWIKFDSPEGRFSVLLPRAPKFEAISDPETKQVTNYRYTDLESGYGFICEYFDVTSTGADLEGFLDMTRDGIVRGAGATKVREEKISLDGYPGRELELSVPVSNGTDITDLTRVFIVGKRVYSVSFLHAKSMDSKVAAQTAAKFFSSIKLTPSK